MIQLPSISELRRVTQALATLDLILEPEWEYRYYSFNSKWSPDEEMASMRDGCGDEWILLLHASGWAGLKGLAHESPAAAVDGLSQALQQAVPRAYGAFAAEPAFRWDATTFCYWCDGDHSTWEHPVVLDGLDTGADTLLEILGSGPGGYVGFAQDYYERELDLRLVEQIFLRRPIDQGMVRALNPKVAVEDLAEDLAEIGYPRR